MLERLDSTHLPQSLGVYLHLLQSMGVYECRLQSSLSCPETVLLLLTLMLMQRLMLLMFLFFQNVCVLEKENILFLYVATCVRHGITVGVLVFRWTRTRPCPGIVPLV
jgi:hypothetical protein